MSNRRRTDIGWLAPLQALVLGLLMLASNHVFATDTEQRPWLPDLLNKDTLRIVITDSGLGGLSVVADAAGKFQQSRAFKKVDLVFVNALFRNEGGYNSLQTREEKLRVFNSALESMQARYEPDLILVACNTLSVLVPDTDFVRSGQVPVVGIVESGIEQIAHQLQTAPAATNILFATQTTVDEGTHKQGLLDLGFEDQQLMTQACPQLTLHIEQGFDSPYTEMLIDAYVDKALSRMGEVRKPLSVSFNCTHFGYSLDFWKLAFESRGVEVKAWLDPNTRMVDFLQSKDLSGRYESTDINVRVVSMIDIPDASRESLGRYLQNLSPKTAAALQHYEKQEALFPWRELLTGEDK